MPNNIKASKTTITGSVYHNGSSGIAQAAKVDYHNTDTMDWSWLRYKDTLVIGVFLRHFSEDSVLYELVDKRFESEVMTVERLETVGGHESVIICNVCNTLQVAREFRHLFSYDNLFEYAICPTCGEIVSLCDLKKNYPSIFLQYFDVDKAKKLYNNKLGEKKTS